MLYKPQKKVWFWVLFGLSSFCFLAAFKRIALIAMAVVAAVRGVLWLFGRLSDGAVSRAANAVSILSVVLLVAYVAVIKGRCVFNA